DPPSGFDGGPLPFGAGGGRRGPTRPLASGAARGASRPREGGGGGSGGGAGRAWAIAAPRAEVAGARRRRGRAVGACQSSGRWRARSSPLTSIATVPRTAVSRLSAGWRGASGRDSDPLRLIPAPLWRESAPRRLERGAAGAYHR